MPQSSGSRMPMIDGSAHNNFSDVSLFNATLHALLDAYA